MKQIYMSASNPIFMMLVGMPGVGKSTFCKEKIDMKSFCRISSDDYIEEVAKNAGKTYSEVFSQAVDFATKSYREDFKRAIESQSNIVWDQTNLSIKKRKGIMA